METTLLCEIDSQITCLKQILGITESLRGKCIKLEKEKDEALKRCEDLEVKIERLSSRKCTNCSFLKNELKKERKDKENLKKEEKAKLLKTIAMTLENLDDGNTNNVNQILTELVIGRLKESPDQKNKASINLIKDTESSEDEDESRVFVNETIIENDSEAPTAFKKGPIIVPETEMIETSPQKNPQNKDVKDITSHKYRTRNSNHSKENLVSPVCEEVEQPHKRLRLSPILSSQKVSPPRDKTTANCSLPSPSVLSEIVEAAARSTVRSDDGPSSQDEKDVAWKMKPNVLMESASTGVKSGGKKLKQMTLSLTRTEKKHDISLSQNFRGGVAKHSDEDHDVIQPSPEQTVKKPFVKKPIAESLEDPDMTVFNPAVTSTCLPTVCETSFDRLPDYQKSPKYKYRRETVRKRNERMRLPGQDCDQCAKYYEAAGLDESHEVRARLDRCSRHRDKYQLRANTPPGFWDPVLPTSP